MHSPIVAAARTAALRRAHAAREDQLEYSGDGRVAFRSQTSFHEAGMVFARHDVDRRGGRVRRVPHGSAEATHRVWRDDPGVASYCSDGETGGKADEFAALFAWMVTSPTRAYVKDVREEDF